MADTIPSSSRAFPIIWIVLGLVLWAIAIIWVWQKLAGPISTGFALLAHLAIFGYLGGLIFLLIGLFSLLMAIANLSESYFNSDAMSFVINTVMTIGGLGSLFLARWFERLIAAHCIRLYLRRPTTSG
jgi:hypothetical protein